MAIEWTKWTSQTTLSRWIGSSERCVPDSCARPELASCRSAFLPAVHSAEARHKSVPTKSLPQLSVASLSICPAQVGIELTQLDGLKRGGRCWHAELAANSSRRSGPCPWLDPSGATCMPPWSRTRTDIECNGSPVSPDGDTAHWHTRHNDFWSQESIKTGRRGS